MNREALVNVISNALRPTMLPEMLRKLKLRLTEKKDEQGLEVFLAHCRNVALDADAWASTIDAGLWIEAKTFAQEQTVYSEVKLASIPVKLGGGGFYALLYFLTRLTKPEVVVETGVAAGFSSRAFLTALASNGGGKLYSSDFPYFRLANAESYIGILVEDDLKANWKLLIGSDRENLPKIASAVKKIDLLHYDSDKSISGRTFALDTIGPKLAPGAIIIFDDIQDNLHFRDYAKGKKHKIFAYGGKFVGLIEPDGAELG